MRLLALALATSMLALLAAGCGSSSDSSSGTTSTAKPAGTTVPAGRLGAAAGFCPSKVGGEQVTSLSCPKKGTLSDEEWVANGKKAGEQFFVWGDEKKVTTASGYVRAYCPSGSKPLGVTGAYSTPTYKQMTNGVEGGMASTSPTGNKTLRIEDSGRAVAVIFTGANITPLWVRAWGLCIGS